MTEFLFINTTISWNKGSSAQVASTRDVILDRDKDARFSLLSYCKTMDAKFERHYGVSVKGYDDDRDVSLGRGLRTYSFRIAVALLLSVMIRALSFLHIRPGISTNERFCRAILDADIVIDLSGDSLSDRGSHSTVNFLGIILSLLLKKTVVCYSQSIGPFSRWTMPIARLALSRVKKITVREQASYDYLLDMGLDPDCIGLFGDCAFNLSVAGHDRIAEILSESGIVPDEKNVIVGFSVSAFMAEFQVSCGQEIHLAKTPYMNVISSLAAAICNAEPRAVILLVPHVIAPTSWSRDDRWACDRLAQDMKDQGDIHVLSSDYTAEELKGVIGHCDFFIGSRMHACIAALSQCVPTAALSWSHKYTGIMERLGMSDYVFDTNKMSAAEISSRVMNAYLDRRNISERLRVSVDAEKASATLGASAIMNAVK